MRDDQCSAQERDVLITGFSRSPDNSCLYYTAEDWDQLRADIAQFNGEAAVVKQELADPDDDVIVVDCGRQWAPLWALQDSISGKLRHTHERLESVINKLAYGTYDPMSDDWLILRVARARVEDHSRRGHQVTRYYTMDHRRAWCMFKAECTKIRLRVEMEGSVFDEFVKKAGGLGRPISELTRRW